MGILHNTDSEIITSVKFIKSSFKINKNDLEILVNTNNKKDYKIILDWFNLNTIQLTKKELIGLTINKAQALIMSRKIIYSQLKKLIGE